MHAERTDSRTSTPLQTGVEHGWNAKKRAIKAAISIENQRLMADLAKAIGLLGSENANEMMR